MKTDNTVDYFDLEISDGEFATIHQLIVHETGSLVNPAKRTLVQNRLRSVLRAKNLKTYGQYYRWLVNNSDRNELHEMICSITTNKTSFFRNPTQMQILKDDVVPKLNKLISKRADKRLKIWSAGCSSGEEPYSIAINCLEATPPTNLSSLFITATDIDTNILEKAQKASYQEKSIGNIEPYILKKYFISDADGMTLSPIVRTCVTFKEVNLATSEYWPKDSFDIIFCRNVLIYMRKDYKNLIMENFNRKLNNGGYLFLGHSETLHGTEIEMNFEGHSIFRKEVRG